MLKSKTGKIITVTVIMFIILPLVGLIMLWASKTNAESNTINIAQSVFVIDGVAAPYEITSSFQIDKEGDYVFHLGWEAASAGMITGFQITDTTGTIIFSCTAESCTIESEIIHLENGNYTIALSFITSEEMLKEFIQSQQMELIDNEPYQFADNLELDMNYTIEILNKQSFNYGMKFGIFTGCVFGIYLVFILCIATTKGKSGKYIFDERQEVMRGRGFKYGFFTLLTWNVLVMMLTAMEIPLPVTSEFSIVLGIMIAVIVFAAYCIWNDSYFALNEHINAIIISFSSLTLLNLLIGIRNLFTGVMFTDGKLGFRSLNLFCAIMLLALLIFILIKININKKDADVQK